MAARRYRRKMTDPTEQPYAQERPGVHYNFPPEAMRAQPYQPSAPPYQPGYPPPPQQYARQPGYPPQGYAPYQQQYAPPGPTRLSPALWIGLGAVVVAVVMTLVGDTTPVLNAQTPLAVGFLAAVGAVAAAIVTLLTSQRALVWPSLILAVGGLVTIWAAYDFYQAHEALAAVQQCFQDLSSC